MAGLVLVGTLVAALLVGGGAPSPPPGGLPDPGAVTGWGLPVVDLAVRLLAVLTVGQLVFAALLATPTSQGPGPGALGALRGATWSAGGWAAAELVALVLTASSIYGVPAARLSAQSVLALAIELPIGRATLWVVVLLLLVVVGSARLARGSVPGRGIHGSAGVLLLAALGAVTIPGVLAGHSAGSDNHVPAVLALSVHVLTASLWVGGLAALLLHGRGHSQTVSAVRRFSALALGCLTLLLLSGVAAALLVAGPPSWSWLGEGWAQLLAAKTALLALLGLIGWRHRRASMPALAAGRPLAFARLGVVEVALMALTLALSVALSASPAPTNSTATTGAPSAATAPGTDPAGEGAPEVPPEEGSDGASEDAPGSDGGAGPSASGTEEAVEDMSGHDHGDLSVSILIDAERFHVASTVRPGQAVTVYNSSDDAATITATDGAFDVEVSARTFITFTAPQDEGDYAFVSRPEGNPAAGFSDTLLVRSTR